MSALRFGDPRAEALFDKSLIRQEALSPTQTQPRLSFLETIREYAAAKLRDRDDDDIIRDRQADCMLWLSCQMEPLLIGPRQLQALRQVDAELDNIRTALGWLLERGRVDDELTLSEAPSRYWVARGHSSEARPPVR